MSAQKLPKNTTKYRFWVRPLSDFFPPRVAWTRASKFKDIKNNISIGIAFEKKTSAARIIEKTESSGKVINQEIATIAPRRLNSAFKLNSLYSPKRKSKVKLRSKLPLKKVDQIRPELQRNPKLLVLFPKVSQTK